MAWFKNLRTMTKLMLSFGLLAGLMAVVGYQCIEAMGQMNDRVATLYQREMAGVSVIKDVATTMALIGRHTRGAFVYTDKPSIDKEREKIDALYASLNEMMARADQTFVTERGKAMVAELKQAFPEYYAICSGTITLALAGKRQEALASVGKAIPVGNRVNALIKAATETKSALAREEFESGQRLYEQARNGTIAALIVAIGIAAGLGYFVAQSIARPLRLTVEVLETVAAGDLSRSFEAGTRDEVGRMTAALTLALARIRDTLSEFRRAAGQLTLASRQLASSSEELSNGAQEQASSLEETTGNLEEMTAAVRKNADNAQQASKVAAGSQQIAEKGGRIVVTTQAAMGEIDASSKRIADIISTVDEIAFQTNLLALNAAVEAARAGEQGRGFAVVAGEVRNLAQRSAVASKEIKTLIEDSVRKVKSGTSLVDSSGGTLREIVAGSMSVTTIVAEIAQASGEQANGISQVGTAMERMDSITQRNAAHTEQLSAMAQDLSQQAVRMQELAGRFKLGEASGKKTRGGPVARPAGY